MDMRRVRDQARGSMVGLAIGDRLGWQTNGLTHKEIMYKVQKHGISGFLDPTAAVMTYGMCAPRTTDETQLSIAVAKSLIEKHEFDTQSQGRAIELACRESTFGWGDATLATAHAIRQWIETKGSLGQRPGDPVPDTRSGEGLGNGVAIKIAPLAIFAGSHGGTINCLTDQIVALGRQTHKDPRSSIAAAVVGATILKIIRRPEFLELSIPNCTFVVCGSVYVIEEYLETRGIIQTLSRFSQRCGIMATTLLSGRSLASAIGTDGSSLESVPFALGTFLRHRTDFRAGVLEAVNAGGNADATASMVGALIGAAVGESGIPMEWKQSLDEFEMLITLADALVLS